jgi:hypothetical protein
VPWHGMGLSGFFVTRARAVRLRNDHEPALRLALVLALPPAAAALPVHFAPKVDTFGRLLFPTRQRANTAVSEPLLEVDAARGSLGLDDRGLSDVRRVMVVVLALLIAHQNGGREKPVRFAKVGSPAGLACGAERDVDFVLGETARRHVAFRR